MQQHIKIIGASILIIVSVWVAMYQLDLTLKIQRKVNEHVALGVNERIIINLKLDSIQRKCDSLITISQLRK